MITKQLSQNDLHDVLTFANKCNSKGFMNNNSLATMKWDWCLENGTWFATYKDKTIISISGIHTFKDGYRALFRGAQLESKPVGLNRYHMQSYCFADQLPLQIKYANGSPIYITTNVENDASGKMTRIDKLFHHLQKECIVEHVCKEEVFYTLQNVWKLDAERYNEIRSRF